MTLLHTYLECTGTCAYFTNIYPLLVMDSPVYIFLRTDVSFVYVVFFFSLWSFCEYIPNGALNIVPPPFFFFFFGGGEG